MDNRLCFLVTLTGLYAAGIWDNVFRCSILCRLEIFSFCTGEVHSLLSDPFFELGFMRLKNQNLLGEIDGISHPVAPFQKNLELQLLDMRHFQSFRMESHAMNGMPIHLRRSCRSFEAAVRSSTLTAP